MLFNIKILSHTKKSVIIDYNLAILHKNTVRIKFNVSLGYKQGRI